MRFVFALTLLTLSCFSGAALSGDTALEKVKTGILPTGGFYSLYAVSCNDSTTASIASTNRGTQWCAQNGSELSCYRNADQASHKACASTTEASNGEHVSFAVNHAAP